MAAKRAGLTQALGSSSGNDATTKITQTMKISDFLALDTNGSEIAADPHGNNLAFCCMTCGHPVLVVALDNQRGSDESHPATCRGCNAQYFLDVRMQSKKLYIHTTKAGA